jgi:hypothetical protein
MAENGSVMGVSSIPAQGGSANISFTVPYGSATQSYYATATDSGTTQKYVAYSAISDISVSGAVPPGSAAGGELVIYSATGVLAFAIAVAYYFHHTRRGRVRRKS